MTTTKKKNIELPQNSAPVLRIPERRTYNDRSGAGIILDKGEFYVGNINGHPAILPSCDSEEYQPLDPDFYIDPKLYPEEEIRRQSIQNNARNGGDAFVRVTRNRDSIWDYHTLNDKASWNPELRLPFRSDDNDILLSSSFETDGVDILSTDFASENDRYGTQGLKVYKYTFESEKEGNVTALVDTTTGNLIVTREDESFIMLPVEESKVVNEFTRQVCPVLQYSRRYFYIFSKKSLLLKKSLFSKDQKLLFFFVITIKKF